MEAILHNEDLLKKLAEVDTAEELNSILTENNIKLDDGFTAQDFLNILKNPPMESEELDEDALNDVSGGSVVLTALILAKKLAEELARRKRNHGGGGHRF